MNKEIFKMSIPINEPILNYSPGSKEKKELKNKNYPPFSGIYFDLTCETKSC